ncbi:thioredoxin domain-containing protein [Belliella sp. R4-6]|uniref:Thioredoxin domain-containing protein n=1 Tax=Belliella alkalica TaxID=1730871 RepID=A0ABS9VBE2_9BACT|nr:thioredoxin domain-containing protein [Belliella alkalica]MCH7413759.1 thioredoxin domain-containing protein [Belliella alkalica]
MKILYLLLIFVITVYQSFGQGVNFQSISLKEALKQAKEEQKYVFVMFGTTHCGYSMEAFFKLGNDRELGEYMNTNFINVAFANPDGLKSKNMNELFKSSVDESFAKLENNEEVMFTNYFIFPNFFFFDPDGNITYFFNGSRKIEKRIMKAAKKGLSPKAQTPVFFKTYFNNKMYPKNKRSLEMLAEGMFAYHQLEIPYNLDYSNPQSISWEDIILPEENYADAVKHLENSLSKGDHYFNQFLAAVIYDKIGDNDKARFYGQNALSNYPKHWVEKKRKLIDELLKTQFSLD